MGTSEGRKLDGAKETFSLHSSQLMISCTPFGSEMWNKSVVKSFFFFFRSPVCSHVLLK